MTSDPQIDEILDVWLGPGEVPAADRRERWWTKDPAFDAMLEERFGALLERAAEGELDSWARTARGALALVILLDQLSRNIFRGTPRAFAQDPRALELARVALEHGLDAELPLDHRVFLYMPLMHAEDLEAQRECVRLFEQLAREAPPDRRDTLQNNVEFAARHLEIIERFGRFPHRNAILGRDTTPEEEAFLREPGSSF
ncbi:MAG: DUF924 domain-containing protein [Myxococcota bacterium]|nr:DUF924 domain-containing protein [Myxococcota bacterium]